MLTYAEANAAFYTANRWCLEYGVTGGPDYDLAVALRREAWLTRNMIALAARG